MNKAHLTAVSRTKLSTPARYLFLTNKLKGRVLDYGCGRGGDVQRLQSMVHGIQGYDPYYKPEMPSGTFDTVMCNFVLNVIPDENERQKVVADILSRLNIGGVAYIAVRNDKEKLNGWTTKGTWQGFVELPYEIIHKTSGYVIYKLTVR
jgi:SAM-dependent methyltransferase